MTRVPVGGQRLICRGKTLSGDDGRPLKELGLRDGGKLMVLGTAAATPEEDALIKQLNGIQKVRLIFRGLQFVFVGVWNDGSLSFEAWNVRKRT